MLEASPVVASIETLMVKLVYCGEVFVKPQI